MKYLLLLILLTGCATHIDFGGDSIADGMFKQVKPSRKYVYHNYAKRGKFVFTAPLTDSDISYINSGTASLHRGIGVNKILRDYRNALRYPLKDKKVFISLLLDQYQHKDKERLNKGITELDKEFGNVTVIKFNTEGMVFPDGVHPDKAGDAELLRQLMEHIEGRRG